MPSFWCETSSPSTTRLGPGGGFEVAVLDEVDGFLLFSASGPGAVESFKNEPGGHRHQRIPPTEKGGRVHTSTVTVAVFEEAGKGVASLAMGDVEITCTRGSGPGGQHRNKVESAVVVVHKPSGIRVRVDDERSQHRNREIALAVLRARLERKIQDEQHRAENTSRKDQVGCGARGDKIRTYRWQDGVVTDHRLGKKARLSDVIKGDLSTFWDAPKKS